MSSQRPDWTEVMNAGDPAAVQAFIDAGANANGPADGAGFMKLANPLFLFLSMYVRDVNQYGGWKKKPDFDTFLDMVEVLLKNGASTEVDDYTDTALHIAIKYAPEQSARLIDLLVEYGADVNAGKIETPIYSASKVGNFKAVKALLEAGANPNEPNKSNSRKPLDLVVYQSWGVKLEILRILLQYGAKIPPRHEWMGERFFDPRILQLLLHPPPVLTGPNKAALRHKKEFERRKNALKFYTYLPKEREDEIIAANLARMNAAEEARAGAGGPTIEHIVGGRRKRRSTRRRRARKGTRRHSRY